MSKISLSTQDALNHPLSIESKSLGVHYGIIEIEGFESDVGFSINAATENLVVSTTHMGGGANSLKLDKKAHGSITSAVLSKTLNSVDIQRFADNGYLIYYFYLPAGAGAAGFISVDVILGTSASHCITWRTLLASLTQGAWNRIVIPLRTITSVTGNGMDYNSIDYLAISANFGAAANTLANMIVDSLYIMPYTTIEVTSIGSGALATESTVNSIKTAVEVMDDWDESDRAKVNLIAGQAGVLGGSGAVAANVPRVTSAINASPSWASANVTTTATAQQLTSVVATQGVIISTPRTNGVSIYIGFSNTVTNTNFFIELEPGWSTPLLPVANLNAIWVYAVFVAEQRKYSYVVL